MMLCTEFEDRLTDYLDGALAQGEAAQFAEHALRCPVCHELLNEVRNALRACDEISAPPPREGFNALEAKVLMKTAPESAMTCAEFEDYLTDYLDGFLPASLFHRWERHAAVCPNCTELPGLVVRSIGACLTYAQDELAAPVGLHERILRATLGTERAEEIIPSLGSRVAAALRGWLDLFVTPQLATVAAMLLVAVLVGTTTLSDDGSISGMYRASLRFAAETYEHGAAGITKNTELTNDVRRVEGEIKKAVSEQQPTQMELKHSMTATPAATASNAPDAVTQAPMPPETHNSHTQTTNAKSNASKRR